MTAADDRALDAVIAEAVAAGTVRAALSQSLTTALTLFSFTDFDEWRAWADIRYGTSGPRTLDTFRAQGAVLALVSERLLQ